MLQEISRRPINLTNYEDADIEWHNNVLTVRCDNGLHLFDFSYNLKCLDKCIDFWETKIEPSKTSPATDLFPPSVMKARMRNFDFSQMILDPALWPHNKQLMKVAIISANEWSPVGFIQSNECAITTLNSAGNIDIHIYARHKWTKLENLSLKLKNIMVDFSLVPSVSYTGSLNINKVKKAVYALETSTMCWAPELNSDKSCYFVSAQKDGTVIFWSLKYEESRIDVKFLGKICDNSDEFIAIKWIPCPENKFLLICSNIFGQVLGYECQMNDDVLKHSGTHLLWPHKDKMVAQYIQYTFVEDNIIIACNKHRHLLLQMIDKNCSILSQNITNINDNKITCIVNSNKNLYVSMLNRELYVVKCAIENGNLNSELVNIEIKSISPVYELYSFAFSMNNKILAVAFLDRTILCRKSPLKLEIVFYAEPSNDPELSVILNNPAKSLTHIWDIIEALRCKTMKLKVLPAMDYNKLYEQSKTDIYCAKVFLIVLILYNNLENILQNGSKNLLPEVQFEEVKDNILALHAMEIMKESCEAKSTDSFDDKYLHESFVMAGIFLEGFCKRAKKDLKDLLVTDTIVEFHNKKNESKYICQCCDEILNGFVCKDGHLNMFCSITFTLIETNNYFFCRGCGVIARPDLHLNKLKCVFCDQYLSKCYLTT